MSDEKTIDITFSEDGHMTIWLPYLDDNGNSHMECDVKGRVDPYDVLAVGALIGMDLMVRVIDPNGKEVSS